MCFCQVSYKGNCFVKDIFIFERPLFKTTTLFHLSSLRSLSCRENSNRYCDCICSTHLTQLRFLLFCSKNTHSVKFPNDAARRWLNELSFTCGIFIRLKYLVSLHSLSSACPHPKLTDRKCHTSYLVCCSLISSVLGLVSHFVSDI